MKPELMEDPTTVSTLLVPNYLVEYLERVMPGISTKKRMRMNLRSGLRILLERYRGLFAMGQLPFSEKVKTQFQDEGLDLKAFKFRPNNEDWIELGILAYGLGVSRCWLFSFLLHLESVGLGEILSIPKIQEVVTTARASRPRKIWQITGRRRYFQRILHFRV